MNRFNYVFLALLLASSASTFCMSNSSKLFKNVFSNTSQKLINTSKYCFSFFTPLNAAKVGLYSLIYNVLERREDNNRIQTNRRMELMISSINDPKIQEEFRKKYICPSRPLWKTLFNIK